MKPLFTLFLASCATVLLTGCIQYGEGKSTGYIYAVDEGIFADVAWFKTSLDSSESDCYNVSNSTKAALDASPKFPVRTTIKYDRHLFNLFGCSPDVIESATF